MNVSIKIKSLTACVLGAAMLISCSEKSGSPDTSVKAEAQPVTTEAAPDTKITIMCCKSVFPELEKTIDQFNGLDNGYFVELADKSDYLVHPTGNYTNEELEALYEEAYNKFRDDVSADFIGGGADIVCSTIHSSMMDMLQKSDALVDLAELMENEISACNSTIIDMCRSGDGLYELPYNYHVSTMIGAREYIGERSSWTIDDVTALYDSLPSGTLLTFRNSRADISNTFISDNQSAYIDHGEGKISLRADELKKTLDFCMRFNYGSRKNVDMNDPYILKSLYGIDGFDSYCSELRKFSETNGESIIVGYPSEQGYSATVNILESFGINKNSSKDVQNGALEFLRFAVSEEQQLSLDYGFPVNNAAFNAMEKEHLENGSMTQQQAEDLTAHISGAKRFDRAEDRFLSEVFVYGISDALQGITSTDQAIEDIRQNLE